MAYNLHNTVEDEIALPNNNWFTNNSHVELNLSNEQSRFTAPQAINIDELDTDESESKSESDISDSDRWTPPKSEGVADSYSSVSSWGSDDPPDSQDLSCDTSLVSSWHKATSYSEDSSLFSEERDEDTASSYSGDHFHLHPAKDPVPKKPAIGEKPMSALKFDIVDVVDDVEHEQIQVPFWAAGLLHGHRFVMESQGSGQKALK